MKLEKYHGLGNDFLITEDLTLINNSNMISQLCNRYTGIGADGLMIVKQNPLEMIFYNQDGTRGEMCGNGIRCFSYYCYLHNIVDSNFFDILTYTLNETVLPSYLFGFSNVSMYQIPKSSSWNTIVFSLISYGKSHSNLVTISPLTF